MYGTKYHITFMENDLVAKVVPVAWLAKAKFSLLQQSLDSTYTIMDKIVNITVTCFSRN